MGIIKTSKLIFDYLRYGEDEEHPEINRAIDGVDIDIEPGRFIAILGHNGSGKSTLAKHINALLAPTEGTVWLDHMDTRDETHTWDIRQEAGMVFQNPDNQIIATVVEEDVGFGPENLGVPTSEIWKRVGEPKCIILDEPTAMLDPNGRKEVLKAVHRLNREAHVTVLLITHYMEEVTDTDYVYVMDHGRVVMQGELFTGR